MTEIGLNSQPVGVPATHDHCADVCGPGAGYAVPPMVVRKFIGQTTSKVVRLADVIRVPQSVGTLTTKNINSADRIEHHATDCKVPKFVPSTAEPGPN
jgi:hypothetical protein